MAAITYILSPSGLISVCFAAGLVALLFRRIRAFGLAALVAGAVIFLLLSTGPVAYWLMRPLEFKYDYDRTQVAQPGAKFIVVMAGYALDEEYYPVSSKVNSSSLFRIVEALHLWLMDQNRSIVVSGRGDVPEIMARVVLSLGVGAEKIIVENESFNSFESARNIQKIVQGEPFILVTSAGHMPRCVSLFRKIGMSPIPAPTDFQVGKNPLNANLLPSTGHLSYSELAMHEYLGIAWYRLKGRI
jgi:uncharacterized SAM-binding protein YcdF (DUF218 family)